MRSEFTARRQRPAFGFTLDWSKSFAVLAVLVSGGGCGRPVPEAASPSCERSTCDDDTGDVVDNGQGAATDPPDDADVLCAAESSMGCFLDENVPRVVDAVGTPGKAIGLVVGVSFADVRLVRGYGATERGGDTSPHEKTVFELASVTKVVTGYLAARSVNNGELLLSEPISNYFGPDVPSYEGTPIRLLHLATHRSGLPKEPTNLIGAPPTPGAGYTRELLEQFLAGYMLPRAPGAAYEYSNLGAGMLGQACVDAAGVVSYESLVQREVALPMGLVDFHVELDEAQQARKIQGYFRGEPAPELAIGPPLQGGGALHATADDLLTFLEAALEGGDPAWEAVMTPLNDMPEGDNAEIGLQLAIEHPAGGPTVYSKNGVSPGFTTQVVFTTDPPVAVVLLSNTNPTQGLLELGKDILAAAADLSAFD